MLRGGLMLWHKETYPTLYLECSCLASEHVVKFCYFVGDELDPPEITIEVQMHQYRSFFRRVVEAIRYIFNISTHYSHWDTTIIDPEDAATLRSYLTKYIDLHTVWAEKRPHRLMAKDAGFSDQ